MHKHLTDGSHPKSHALSDATVQSERRAGVIVDIGFNKGFADIIYDRQTDDLHFAE